jgi:hypothetical protein
MQSSQFLFKTSYLWALGELAGVEDILKSMDFPIVQRRAGMRDGHVLFHYTCLIKCL